MAKPDRSSNSKVQLRIKPKPITSFMRTNVCSHIFFNVTKP